MMRTDYPVSRVARKQYRGQASMLRLLAGVMFAAMLALAALATNVAHAADQSIRFEGGIGSQPLRAGGLVNDVLTVPPGGRPWVIERLSVDINSDSTVRVDGRGLLLGGGDNVGTAGGQRVRARLFCTQPQPAPAPAIVLSSHQTDLVDLDVNGDFRIRGTLDPQLPMTCPNPRLLIVNAGGSWFAAGIPKR